MNNEQTPQSIKLCETAYLSLGQDLAPIEGPLGCAETVCNLLQKAFGDTWKTVSTTELYTHMLGSPYYAEVTVPLPGDIVVSPTGYGNGNMSNGHTGVVGNNGDILSNDSSDTTFSVNYDLVSWRARYVGVGGFPMVFFRRIE